MFELIKNFPAQLLGAMEIGEKVSLKTKFSAPIKNIVVSGLGGSGIGGDVVGELVAKDLKIPLAVNRSYFLPAFADASTLIIICSYSGNTEEMVSCTEKAIKDGYQPILIASGGKLEEMADKHSLDLIKIPAGFPPRSCLGYAVTQLFYVLAHYGLIDNSFKTSLKKTAAFLEKGQAKTMGEAEALAAKTVGKVIIAYAEDKYLSTIIRLKQQINENGKMLCYANIVPELNHNELVGLRKAHPELAVIMFRSDEEFSRNKHRLDFTKNVVTGVIENFHQVEVQGGNNFEKHFYLIHFGDWLSYYYAGLQGFDAMEIDVLIKLKDQLSATPF